MQHCPSPFLYQRRHTREVVVGDPAKGGVIIGGNHPVVVQSMLTCDTMDTEACVKQIMALVAAGCQIVRLTAPTVNDAANLKNIVDAIRSKGCHIPLVADIHFKPEAAMEAAKWVEMIRINPGNYADSKKFATKDYSEDEYGSELERIEERFTLLVQLCKQLGRAMRIGSNHGSLSDRIMNRYGDTPMGMVESVLEFARIARKNDFHNFKFSLKSSNPKVMMECYRLLAAKLGQLGADWNYPIHLGVTEAGEGEDGRIKSAIGIGALLCDGVGDTLRVSLTEDSTREIPVCHALLAQIPVLTTTAAAPGLSATADFSFDPFVYQRRPATEVELAPGIKCGGIQTVRVIVSEKQAAGLKGQASSDIQAEGVYETLSVCEVDPTQPLQIPASAGLVTVRDGLSIPVIAAFRLLAAKLKEAGQNHPVLLKDTLQPNAQPLPADTALLRASTAVGALLADGIGDAILVRGEADPAMALRLAYNILQAVGCRSFKTDYVACPGCGRTLFNLQTIIAKIKARTQHLKGVKIAVMGCIVNGPGEMADADFGYVGGAPGKVNLYVGKKPVRFNIPEVQAVDCLVDLIKEHGKWMDPIKP